MCNRLPSKGVWINVSIFIFEILFRTRVFYDGHIDVNNLIIDYCSLLNILRIFQQQLLHLLFAVFGPRKEKLRSIRFTEINIKLTKTIFKQIPHVLVHFNAECNIVERQFFPIRCKEICSHHVMECVVKRRLIIRCCIDLYMPFDLRKLLFSCSENQLLNNEIFIWPHDWKHFRNVLDERLLAIVERRQVFLSNRV